MLKAGTNANIVNTEGRTALALALQMGNEQIAAILKPYTSESLPATPLPAQQTQQHPYTAMQSPSSPNGTSFSFSEAVDAESVGLFEGCSIVYENSSSSSGISSKMRYVIACKEHLVEEEEGGSGKIVVCTTRYKMDIYLAFGLINAVLGSWLRLSLRNSADKRKYISAAVTHLC